MTLIVGISGKKGSGKDTLGAAMADAARQLGWEVVHRNYADALKEEVACFLTSYTAPEAYEFFDLNAEPEVADRLMETLWVQPTKWWQKLLSKVGFRQVWTYDETDYEDLIEQFNNRETKERWRFLLQWWGTEYRRSHDPNYWLTCMEEYVDQKYREIPEETKLLVYIADVRFPNEKKHIESMGGYTVRVNRPSVETNDPHPSETALDNVLRSEPWNAVVRNEDMDLLTFQVKSMQLFAVAANWKDGSAPL